MRRRRIIGQAPPLSVVPGAIAPVPGGAAPRRVFVAPRGVQAPQRAVAPARPEHWSDYPRTASEVRDAIRVSRRWAERYRVPAGLMRWGSDLTNAGMRDATTRMRAFVQDTGDDALRALAAGEVEQAAHEMRALLNYIGRVQAVSRNARDREGFLDGLVQSMTEFRRELSQAVEHASESVANAAAPFGAGLLIIAILLLFSFVGGRR